MDQEEKRVSATREYFRSKEFKVFLWIIGISVAIIPIVMLELKFGPYRPEEIELMVPVLIGITPFILAITFLVPVILLRILFAVLTDRGRLAPEKSNKLRSLSYLIPITLIAIGIIIGNQNLLWLICALLICWLIFSIKIKK